MRATWKHVTAAVVTSLLIGTAIGWWGHRARLESWRGDRHYPRLLEKFTSKLDLTAGQKVRVASILDAKRQKVQALRSEVRPRFEEIRSATDAEIAGLLTPDQQVRFEKMKARREQRRRKHFMRDE